MPIMFLSFYTWSNYTYIFPSKLMWMHINHFFFKLEHMPIKQRIFFHI